MRCLSNKDRPNEIKELPGDAFVTLLMYLFFNKLATLYHRTKRTENPASICVILSGLVTF